MEIVEYRQEYKKSFIELNTAWLEKYVALEPLDLDMMYNVETYLARGATIYFAVESGAVLATCMIMPLGGDVWEVCKLAADERYRQRGAGSAVLRACVEYAAAHGARKLMLVTNHVLTAALRLYEKFGFKSVPLDCDQFETADLQYELELPSAR